MPSNTTGNNLVLHHLCSPAAYLIARSTFTCPCCGCRAGLPRSVHRDGAGTGSGLSRGREGCRKADHNRDAQLPLPPPLPQSSRKRAVSRIAGVPPCSDRVVIGRGMGWKVCCIRVTDTSDIACVFYRAPSDAPWEKATHSRHSMSRSQRSAEGRSPQ